MMLKIFLSIAQQDKQRKNQADKTKSIHSRINVGRMRMKLISLDNRKNKFTKAMIISSTENKI